MSKMKLDDKSVVKWKEDLWVVIETSTTVDCYFAHIVIKGVYLWFNY